MRCTSCALRAALPRRPAARRVRRVRRGERRPRTARARGLGEQRDVLVDPARQVADPAVAGERVDVVADPLDEVAVVADHDERARPAVEQVLERGQRVDVEVVGRLVEQQDVGLGHQQAHQLQAAPLAAGEVAHRASATGRRGSRSGRTASPR